MAKIKADTNNGREESGFLKILKADLAKEKNKGSRKALKLMIETIEAAETSQGMSIGLTNPKKCCICYGKYKGFGHNAKPVKNGRCCSICNNTIVILERIRRMQW